MSPLGHGARESLAKTIDEGKNRTGRDFVSAGVVTCFHVLVHLHCNVFLRFIISPLRVHRERGASILYAISGIKKRRKSYARVISPLLLQCVRSAAKNKVRTKNNK